MANIIYRVHLKISYCEATFDFAASDDAVGLLETLATRGTVVGDEDREYSVWMEIIETEDF